MVGKVDCVDDLRLQVNVRILFCAGLVTYVNIVAETLQRKDSGLAPYISVGDMGLYAEHPLVHCFALQVALFFFFKRGTSIYPAQLTA